MVDDDLPGLPTPSQPAIPAAEPPHRPGRWRLALLVAGLVLLVGGAAFAAWWYSSPRPDAGPLDGRLVVTVRPPERAVEPLLVEEPGALPVRAGGIMSLEVRLSQPAFAYLVWLDTEGRAGPHSPGPNPMRCHQTARTAALLTAAGLLITITLGCSSGLPTGEVQGKVSYKGKPVTEGTVTFLNPKGEGDAEGQITADGTYAIPKVVVGDYTVIVTPPMHIVDTDPGKSPPAPVEKPAPNIPMKYRQQGTTTLKASVKTGKNEIDLDMK